MIWWFRGDWNSKLKMIKKYIKILLL